MIVELHIIQNFAPSNLNRDDANAPKDCEFGGYRRARISSQCIKRAVRWHPTFRKAVRDAGGDLAVRTKRVIGKVAELLQEKRGGEDPADALTVAERAVALFGVKRDDKHPDKTKILLYLGDNELDELTDIAARNWDVLSASHVVVETEDESEDEAPRKKAKQPKLSPELKALQKEIQTVVSEKRVEAGSYAADVALFGRMVADKNVKNMNVEAACQVAHAISTHKVEMEMDYFTAVDDLLPDEDTGSDMIGVVEFNSSCFYRYSCIDVEKLRENLGLNGDLLKAAIRGYLEASVKAVPTGKQNSMAAQNPAGFARVLVRKDGFPWSLTNAFQRPVFAGREGSLEERSIAELDAYFSKLTKVYGDGSVLCDTGFNVHDPASPSLAAVLSAVEGCLDKELSA